MTHGGGSAGALPTERASQQNLLNRLSHAETDNALHKLGVLGQSCLSESHMVQVRSPADRLGQGLRRGSGLPDQGYSLFCVHARVVGIIQKVTTK